MQTASALLGLLLLLVDATAHAEESSVAEAQRLLAVGEKALRQGDFRSALQSFEASRQSAPLSTIDYRIGQAHEELGYLAAAASSYRRFLLSTPSDTVLCEDARRRIDAVQWRLKMLLVAPLTKPLRPERPDWPIVLAVGVSVVIVAIVAVLALVVAPVAPTIPPGPHICYPFCIF